MLQLGVIFAILFCVTHYASSCFNIGGPTREYTEWEKNWCSADFSRCAWHLCRTNGQPCTEYTVDILIIPELRCKLRSECQPRTDRLGSACTFDLECMNQDYRCSNGRCVHKSTVRVRYERCYVDAECPNAHRCINYDCVYQPTESRLGQYCKSYHTECRDGENLRCDRRRHICVHKNEYVDNSRNDATFTLSFDYGYLECVTNQDCPAAKKCNKNNRCVKKKTKKYRSYKRMGECESIQDCPQGYWCGSFNRCQPRIDKLGYACYRNKDCENSNYRCFRGRCEHKSTSPVASGGSCYLDAECPNNSYRCLRGRCEHKATFPMASRGSCYLDAECPNNSYRCINSKCVLRSSGSIGPCEASPDCPKGYKCVGFKCVPGVGLRSGKYCKMFDTECGTNTMRCDIVNHVCVPA